MGRTISALAILALLGGMAALGVLPAYATTVSVTATAVTSCGNGTIEPPETCDGGNLASSTCSALGFASGVLACRSNCVYDTSACIAPSSGPATTTSGGGGGGSPAPAIPATGVTFSGRAYPKSSVTLLKDSSVAATAVAGADAKFQISLAGLSAGNYMFSLYSEDERGYRSSLSTFPLSVTAGTTLSVSGIFISPSLTTDKIEVKQGDVVRIFGKGFPQSEVTILVNSDEPLFLKSMTDSDGAYLYDLDSTLLEIGAHLAKARLAAEGEISAFGKSAEFRVGSRSVARPERLQAPTVGDLNADGKVNIVDFSVLAYWYKRPTVPVGFDLNKDGKITLVDFSILAFYWTG